MAVKLHDGAQSEAVVPAVAKDGVPVPFTFTVNGQTKDAKKVTVAGKTIVYTDFLTTVERMKISRAMLPEDTGAPEAYGFSHVAAKVRMVDDVILTFPKDQAGIEANLNAIGDDVAEWLFEEGGRAYAERRKERAKNSLTTVDGD
jgi:hypothetical protein